MRATEIFTFLLNGHGQIVCSGDHFGSRNLCEQGIIPGIAFVGGANENYFLIRVTSEK